MTPQVKIEKVQDLTEKLNRAKAVVLTDYRGLTVAQISELRSKIEAAGAEYEVTKNTLLSRSTGVKEVPTEALEGPTATLFAFEDEVAPLKALADFIKANSLPAIKIGFIGNTLLSPDQVNELAKLPSRDVLIGKLLGMLQSNQSRLVSVLSGNIRKLVYVLDSISKAKT